MKAAVIGGTFNPIHIGHLLLAEEVLNEFDYEKIIFVPANIPPHKTIKNNIDKKHRLKMTKFAVKNSRDFIMDPCEIERGGISYTIDTVKYISEKYNINKPGYILGDDLIKDFYTWRDAEKLSSIADLIVARRKYKENINFKYKHKNLNNLMLPISSSEIRKRIILGKPVRFLLTKDVLNYINKNNLYRES